MNEKRIGVTAIATLALVALLAFVPSAHGQQDEAQGADTEDLLSGYGGPQVPLEPPSNSGMNPDLLATDSDFNELDRSIIFPEVWCGDIEGDEQTAQSCWKAYRAGLDYYEWGLAHRSKVLWWQHMTTRAIFFVVLVLVGVGVYFSWVQFRAAPLTESTHEIEVSMKGVKVSSPVLGVIILTLSLAFFYLYLRYVYPVQEVI